MFERYTEKARRSIFFARYEASQFGSPFIETEHLLLGLLRESRELVRLLPPGSGESIRSQIETHTLLREKVSTSVDLPLSNECKRVLAYGADEADRLGHKHIGTEHLFLGLFRETGSFAAAILRERSLSPEKLRERFAKASPEGSSPSPRSSTGEGRVEIHGIPWFAETIRERVRMLRRTDWHWQKQPWKSRDVALNKEGKLSFDTQLASDANNFDLQRNGWQKDQCPICFWELFEDENRPEHSTGYTNGRDWVCNECYEKFLQDRDYFESPYPDIT